MFGRRLIKNIVLAVNAINNSVLNNAEDIKPENILSNKKLFNPVTISINENNNILNFIGALISHFDDVVRFVCDIFSFPPFVTYVYSIIFLPLDKVIVCVGLTKSVNVF